MIQLTMNILMSMTAGISKNDLIVRQLVV